MVAPSLSSSTSVMPQLLSPRLAASTSLAPDLAMIIDEQLDREEGETGGPTGQPPPSLEETLAALRSKLFTMKRTTPRSTSSVPPSQELAAQADAVHVPVVNGTAPATAIKRPIEECIDTEIEVEGSIDRSHRSSSESSSDDSSESSSDEDDAPAPAKRARLQKAIDEEDEGDSDEDVNFAMGIVKTANEVEDKDVGPPPIDYVPDDYPLGLLGTVESVIGNVAVIKARMGGNERILDEGTLVCLRDRRALGVIFETFGTVTDPRYTVRFPASSDPLLLAAPVSTEVCHVDDPDFSAYVFTAALRSLPKGSDASNLHDEEPAAHEIEYSDDEQEAAARKEAKFARRERTASRHPSATPSRQHSTAPSRQASAAPQQRSRHASRQSSVASHSSTRRRDEVEEYAPREDADLDYTPLERPAPNVQQRRLDAFSPPPDDEAVHFNARSIPDQPEIVATSANPTGPESGVLGPATRDSVSLTSEVTAATSVPLDGNSIEVDASAMQAGSQQAEQAIATSEPMPSLSETLNVETLPPGQPTKPVTSVPPLPAALSSSVIVEAVSVDPAPAKEAAAPTLAEIDAKPSNAAAILQARLSPANAAPPTTQGGSLLERISGPPLAAPVNSLLGRIADKPDAESIVRADPAPPQRSPARPSPGPPTAARRSRSPPPRRGRGGSTRGGGRGTGRGRGARGRAPSPGPARNEQDHYSPPRRLSPAPPRRVDERDRYRSRSPHPLPPSRREYDYDYGRSVPYRPRSPRMSDAPPSLAYGSSARPPPAEPAPVRRDYDPAPPRRDYNLGPPRRDYDFDDRAYASSRSAIDPYSPLAPSYGPASASSASPYRPGPPPPGPSYPPAQHYGPPPPLPPQRGYGYDTPPSVRSPGHGHPGYAPQNMPYAAPAPSLPPRGGGGAYNPRFYPQAAAALPSPSYPGPAVAYAYAPPPAPQQQGGYGPPPSSLPPPGFAGLPPQRGPRR